jgi:outer membrane protein assembly factor BamB
MKKIIIITVLTALALAGCTRKFKMKRDFDYPESPWPFARHDISATGHNPDNFGGKLNLIWEDRVSGAPAGPLIIGAGCLIVPDSKGKVNFFNSRSGDYKGALKMRHPVRGGAVLADSLAFFGLDAPKNELVCLNLYNRNILWKRHLKDISGAPIIVENRLFVSGTDGRVFCLDCLSGQTVWYDSSGAGCLAGPTYYEGRVYCPMEDGSVNIYDASIGELIQRLTLGGPLVTKVVINDYIFMVDNLGGFYALETGTGRPLWDRKFDWPVWCTPAADEHLVYFGDGSGLLHALDKKTGETVWEYKTDGVIISSPVVAGQYVVFASLDRFLYCLDRATGRLVSRREYDQEIRMPVITSDGSVYVALQNGIIQCLGD